MDTHTPGNERITPEPLFLNRRKFLQLSAAIGTGAALAACGVIPDETAKPPAPATTTSTNVLTSIDDYTGYVNFYEFSMDKYRGIGLAQKLKTDPWPIEIGGLVENPMTVDAADLIAAYPSEERVYRMRCVEGWSMVIPWVGFSLNKLLKDLKVQKNARYVKFTTLLDPEQMPGQKVAGFDWPYVEGLRLDEAENDLTILASGAYEKPLMAQNGAPLRLVVPWKYGFKSIKSIVKIELLEEQPLTFWSEYAPDEYGFYSNVNPEVDHPRWSQATERRIGEDKRIPTLMFNGYENEVAALYEGMDLRENY